jgi:hypothetical protein
MIFHQGLGIALRRGETSVPDAVQIDDLSGERRDDACGNRRERIKALAKLAAKTSNKPHKTRISNQALKAAYAPAALRTSSASAGIVARICKLTEHPDTTIGDA